MFDVSLLRWQGRGEGERMRHLSSEEVCGLQSFLVADNDEAVGIELHIGKDYRCGYDAPDKIVKYSLSDLQNGEFIEAGDVMLLALVGDKLYYRNKWDYTSFTRTEYAYRGVNPENYDYMYVRAIVTYKSPISFLSKEEVLPLEHIRVENNKKVVGVRLIRGCRGIGGSNTSGFSSFDDTVDYTTEMLVGHDPIFVRGCQICALVGDVLYLKCKDRNGEPDILTVDYRQGDRVLLGDGIAYDTVEATRVVLLLDEE